MAVMTLPAWVLTESVDVTVVYRPSDDTLVIYLLERVDLPDGVDVDCYVPNALTLTFDDGTVLMNGRSVDLGDDLMTICGLVDEAGHQASPDNLLPIGRTIRLDAPES